jgi:hypothetical protein
MTRILASLALVSCLGFCACSDDDGDDDGGDGGGSGGSGGSGSGTVTFNCQVEDDAGEVIGCAEHTVPRAAEEASRQACEDDDQGSVVDECSTVNFIGECSLVSGNLVMHYYSTTGDAADAEEMCTALGGTWTDA